MRGIRARLAERDLELDLNKEARSFLIENGSNLEMGARPLRRAVERFIEDALSEVLLRGEIESPGVVSADIDHPEAEEGDEVVSESDEEATGDATVDDDGKSRDKKSKRAPRVFMSGWNDAGTKAFMVAVSSDNKDRWVWGVDAASARRTTSSRAMWSGCPLRG